MYDRVQREPDHTIQATNDAPSPLHEFTPAGSLIVGHADDPCEQAADRAADEVQRRLGSGSVRRSSAGANDPLGGLAVPADTERQISASSGRALDQSVRSPLEGAFGGADFGSVRIHDNGGADQLSRSLQAEAFTVGSDIFFRSGNFAPNTPSGQHLLAHELAHVAQGAGGAARRIERVVHRFVSTQQRDDDLKRFGATGRGKAEGEVPPDSKTSHPTSADPALAEEASKLKGTLRPTSSTDLKRFGATGRGKAEGEVPPDSKTSHPTSADPALAEEARKLKATVGVRDEVKRKGRGLNALDPRMYLPESKGGFSEGKKSLKAVVATVTTNNIGQGPNATAALDPGDYGICDTEVVRPTFTAFNDGTDWHLAATALAGDYSKVCRLPVGCQEATVAAADQNNYEDMIDHLKNLGGPRWYAQAAVVNHESVHEKRLKPALKKVEPKIQKWFQELTVPYDAVTMNSAGQAVAAIQQTPGYANVMAALRDLWDAKYVDLIWADHWLWTDAAERKITNPRIKAIKAAAKANNW
jgi:hypothetical protein